MPINTDFDGAKDLFGQAKDEFDQVDDKECKELSQECEERGEETGDQKEALRKKLEDMLDKLIGEDQEERAYNYVVDFFNNTYEENQDELQTKLGDALKKIEESTSPEERAEIVKDLDRIVDKLVDKMDKVGAAAGDALENDLYDPDKVAKVEDIKRQCDEYGDKMRKYVADAIDDALQNAGTNDQTSVDDLIALYHRFSVDVDTIGSRMPAEDDGVPESAPSVRSRLDRIVGQLECLYELERDLREKVHHEIDDVFEEESLLGNVWTKEGDRYEWEYPDNDTSRIADRELKLNQKGQGEGEAPRSPGQSLARSPSR